MDQLDAHARSTGVQVIRHSCDRFSEENTFHLASALAGRKVDGGQTTPAAVLDQLRTRAQDRLLLILDDFHVADPHSAQTLLQLAADQPEAPFLLVFALRPRQVPLPLRSILARCAKVGAVDRLECRPLSSTDSAAMLGLSPNSRRGELLHRASGGNPFYLLALAAEETDDVNPFSTDVTTSFLSEIAGLTTAESDVLSAAAVLGPASDIAGLAVVADTDTNTTAEAVEQLIHRDLLRLADGGANLTLRHPVLGQLIRRGIEPARLAAAHRRALRLLGERGASAADQAVHVEQSLAIGEQQTRILVDAGQERLWSDPESAARWLDLARRSRAHAEQDRPTQCRTTLLLAKAMALTGRLPESRELLHTALASMPARSPLRTEAVVSCAMTEFALGQHNEARAMLRAELDNSDDADLAITCALVEAMTGFPMAEVTQPDLDAASQRGDTWQASALALRGLCRLYTGSPSDAVALIAAAGSIFDRLDDVSVRSHLPHLAALCWAELHAGRFLDAQRHVERSIGQARDSGQNFVLPVLLSCLSMVQRRTGSAVLAQRTAREAREAAIDFHTAPMEGVALAAEALCAAQTGAPDERGALAMAERAVELLPVGVTRWNNNAVFTLGHAALLAGDPVRAIAVLSQASGGPELTGVMPIMRPMWFETLTAAAVAAGRSDVRHWATRAAQAAHELRADLPMAYGHAAKAHLLRATGDHGQARQYYRRAADNFAAAGVGHDQARVLLAAARCDAAVGDHETANTLLSLAKELARRHQSVRLRDEIEREAARLAESAPDGWTGALTEREQEIARIAGTGKRTKEIADELSLSPRTVDVHLANIYRKLELNSRAALVRLVTAGATAADPR